MPEVKSAYKVPVSLARGLPDHEIGLGGNSWQMRPMPIKQIGFFLGGIIVVAWCATSTFIADSGSKFIALFVLWSLVFVLYMGQLTKTKELRITTVPPLLAYLPKSARRVFTRRDSNPSGFYSIVGIESIDEDGRIHYSDGGQGQVYLVVGSASYLLFDEDRVGILKRNDDFWKKVETTCEHVFITTKEPQRIYHQMANLERRNQALGIRDPDLIELQNEQYDILTQHVGGKFASIHQYLLLKGKSEDALRRGHTILQAEVENSDLMIKEATMLDREEAQPMLRVFYSGIDDQLTPTAT
ncbi:hypothetical protein [Nocardiopsis sp. JB363]|uniref:hypothetical protein n=1 Tax=Nocardiopsis sp. JB363 TaxID=1434837 RepID=UPI00097A6816|nr:hypothetical protein [Nocardiopsis sp. JB363]SIO87186.1 hypothetical membrane protein [Nocardiopsis sp. JB363]